MSKKPQFDILLDAMGTSDRIGIGLLRSYADAVGKHVHAVVANGVSFSTEEILHLAAIKLNTHLHDKYPQKDLAVDPELAIEFLMEVFEARR